MIALLLACTPQPTIHPRVAHDEPREDTGWEGACPPETVRIGAFCIDAYEATGNIVYEMIAEELAHFAIRTMWDDERGGFFDRACTGDGAEVGLLRRRLKPFVANCDAARMLRRLAVASGTRDFAERAERTLAAIAPAACAHGPSAAHYVLAVFEAAR